MGGKWGKQSTIGALAITKITGGKWGMPFKRLSRNKG